MTKTIIIFGFPPAQISNRQNRPPRKKNNVGFLHLVAALTAIKALASIFHSIFGSQPLVLPTGLEIPAIPPEYQDSRANEAKGRIILEALEMQIAAEPDAAKRSKLSEIVNGLICS